MQIKNIKHKGLKNFVEKNQAKGLPAAHIEKIRDIISFVLECDEAEDILVLHAYKPHILRGDRAGTYSLHVTANWRMTFKIDEETCEIYDLDFEDYH